MGMISEPYRVGKYMVNSHLEYRLWHNDELIAECKTYEECQQMAESATAYTQFQTVEHYKIAAAIAAGIRMRSNAPHEGLGAASSRTVPLDAVVGGLTLGDSNGE